VFCAPSQVSYSVIGGKVVVKDGQLATVELGPVIEQHNRLAKALYQAAN
jgi:8-oxoguanine deaminase